MAKGKVKKGFKGYLLILFLAIIATFLIIITVMLFSPFKNILGFKYFTYKDNEIVYNVTGGKENEYFDFQNIDNINIDCTYANVKVERNYKAAHYGFKFDHAISGFARSDHDTDYSYEISYQDNSNKQINIKVHEPEGFLFFSKKSTITVLIPTSETYTLNNTTITVNNTSGNVYIGNNEKVLKVEGEEFRNYITVESINVNTNSGKTIIFPYANKQFKNIYLNTGKGDVDIRHDLTITGDFEIYSDKGDLKFKKIVHTSQEPAILDINNAEFSAPYFEGDIELAIKSGYLNINDLKGSITSNNAVEQMSKAKINIKKFDGNMSFPYANSTDVTLGEVTENSQIYIHATEGDVKIEKMNSDIAKIETTKGDINIYTYAQDLDLKTTSGSIDVIFDNTTIANEIHLISKTGDVSLNVHSTLAFLLEVRNAKGELREDQDVKVAWLDTLTQNPMPILGGGKLVSIITDGLVNIDLIKA